MINASKSIVVRIGLLLLSAAGFAPAQSAPADRPAEQPLGPLVVGYCADTGARVGLHVVRLEGGKILADVRSGELLLPASNQKILTAAVALKRLGGDFVFRTKLALAGRNLLVIGDGDPTTGDAQLADARGQTIYAVFDRWAEALKNSGRRSIRGDLVIRAGIFQPPLFHPDWPAGQRQRWYAAPVAGVNFSNNCLNVGFSLQGKRVQPIITPSSRFFAVRSRVRPGKRHLWHCRFDKAGTEATLTGTVTRTTPDPLPVAVPNPPMLFGCVLADRLARSGVEVKGKLVASTDPAEAFAEKDLLVVAAETTPLVAALARANKESLNMMAECLLLRSAVEPGSPATWRKAAKVATQVLETHYGLSADQFRIADGSGLSRTNRASPAALTAVLRQLADDGRFVRSLAVAGVDGSLRARLTGPGFRGRILGKTGSLVGVSALSGYVLDRAARPVLAFSIIVNGRTRGKRRTARGLQDAICEILIRAVDASPGSGPASRPSPEPSQ